MANTVLPILALQKPHHKTKVKEHMACFERSWLDSAQLSWTRMKAWKEGDLAIFLTEGMTLQRRLPKSFTKQKEQNLARSFANLCSRGRLMLLWIYSPTVVGELCFTLNSLLMPVCQTLGDTLRSTCSNSLHPADGTTRHPPCCLW